MVVRIIPDASARAAAFETGEILLGGFSPVPLNDVKRLEATGKFNVETRGYEYLAPMFLMEFNLSNPYLKDIRVRRAIAHAVDRDLIVKTIWFGFGRPATGPVPSVLTQFYSSDLTKYAFDLKKAEELLEEAGLKHGAEIRSKRFKLIHDFLPYGNDFQRTVEYLKQALAKVDIDVEIRSQDIAAFLKRVYTDNDFDFTTNFLYALPDPTIGVQRIYWSKNIKKGVPFSNASGYNNPETDKLIEAIQVEHDRRKRKELIARFQQVAVDDLPVLDLFEVKFFTLANKRVQNRTDTAEGVYSSFSRVWIKR